MDKIHETLVIVVAQVPELERGDVTGLPMIRNGQRL
jgi:hypothetical protein